MKLKNEWKWWLACGIASILIVGWVTNFKFGAVEFRNGEPYYAIEAFSAIQYLTSFLAGTRYVYLLIDLLTSRYNFLALLISIVNPLAALLIVILFFFNLQGLRTFREMNPDVDFSARLIPIFIFIGLLVFQSVIEVKVLKKMWAFIQKDNTPERQLTGIK